MTEVLRWGILGTGGIAHSQVTALLANGFTLSAIGSRSQAKANSFAQEFGIRKAHGSYEALVSDSDVDIVYIATPNPFHAPNALLALSAGKHVLVEKPFTLNATEAESVVSVAELRHLVVLEAMWTRFLPHMAQIREIIAAGVIGELRGLIADHGQVLPADPRHRVNDPGLGGGALLDLGIYPVSLAHDILGTPSFIQARATMTSTGVDRQTTIILGYDGGQQAVLQTALDSRGPNRACIIGTTGRIEIDRVWFTPTSFTVYDSHDVVTERFERRSIAHGMQYQSWELERLIRSGGTSDILPPRESVQIMRTLDEVRRNIGLRYPSEEDCST